LFKHEGRQLIPLESAYVLEESPAADPGRRADGALTREAAGFYAERFRWARSTR
jgi:LysR family malonate utilization transcriptional regulator